MRQDERDGDERNPYNGGHGHGIGEGAEVKGPTDEFVSVDYAESDRNGLEKRTNKDGK